MHLVENPPAKFRGQRVTVVGIAYDREGYMLVNLMVINAAYIFTVPVK